MGWLYVPGVADLKPRSTSLSQNIAPFVLSKGKLTPQPASWPGWKKRAWAHAAHDAKGKGMDGQLVTDVLHGRGPQAGESNNTPGKSPGLLNPAWVEQLMGWVPGQSSFSASATEWSRWLALWRSWLFGGS